MKKKNRGMCEGTGWATRLRKRGKKRKDLRGTCEGTGQATRLRKSGKRRLKRGLCECTGTVGYWLKKRGKK